MGQYYKVVNITKKQCLTPSKFDDGSKLLEFIGGDGVMLGLSLLITDGNGRGGGDAFIEDESAKLIGSWAGDQIVITGDYSDKGKFTSSSEVNLYSETYDLYEDISLKVKVLADKVRRL